MGDFPQISFFFEFYGKCMGNFPYPISHEQLERNIARAIANAMLGMAFFGSRKNIIEIKGPRLSN